MFRNKAGKKDELIQGLVKEQKVKITTLVKSYEYTFKQQEEINSYIKELMANGEYIIRVEPVLPTLEEVYFHYIKPDKSEETKLN